MEFSSSSRVIPSSHIALSLLSFQLPVIFPFSLLKTTEEKQLRADADASLVLFCFCFFVVWVIFHLILAALIVFGYHDELETVPGVDVAAFDVVHTSPNPLAGSLSDFPDS